VTLHVDSTTTLKGARRRGEERGNDRFTEKMAGEVFKWLSNYTILVPGWTREAGIRWIPCNNQKGPSDKGNQAVSGRCAAASQARPGDFHLQRMEGGKGLTKIRTQGKGEGKSQEGEQI